MPGRSRARAKAASEPGGPDAVSLAPQMFLAQGARAALFGLDAFEANLRIWRTAGDALREMARRQQDATLLGLHERLSSTNGSLILAHAPSITAPFETAREAYEKIGDAVLTAQRRALEAMSQTA